MTDLKERKTEILIIGAGAAGLSVYYGVKNAGGDALLCDERSTPGGILPQCIHHGFGLGYFGKDLTGPEYLSEYLKKAAPSGLENDLLLSSAVLSVNEDRTALLSTENGLLSVSFSELVLAAGCREKPFFALPAEGPRPSGIYTAGEAQELLNLYDRDIGENIVILGSGDIGQIMARRFTLRGKNVVALIEQNGHLGGLLRNQKECIAAFRIPVILNATVTKVHGYPSLSGVTVFHSDTGTEEFLPCDTLVTSLGLIPDRTIAEPLVRDGEYPSWIHFAGNAGHVHEIVDSVTREGEELGKKLADALRRSCGD